MSQWMWFAVAAGFGVLIGALALLLWLRWRTPGLPTSTEPTNPLASTPDLLETAEVAPGEEAPNEETPNGKAADEASSDAGKPENPTEDEGPSEETMGPPEIPKPEPMVEPPREPPAPPPPLVLIQPGWNADAVLRQLEASSPQIQSLYLELGYSLSDERRCQEILDAMRQQIRTEIPDLGAFRDTLTRLIAQAEQSNAHTPPALRQARQRKLLDPLLRASLDVLDDETALLRVLNRNPVMEALPFVEQIPIYRDGKVNWRTPVELKILRKRPRDPGEIIDLLSELHRRVRTSELRRPASLQNAVLDAIGRVERDLRRPNAYLPTSLRALVGRIEDWLHKVGRNVDPERRQRLDGFLRQLVEVRHCMDNAVAMQLPVERHVELQSRLGSYHRTALELADHYLHAHWLQRPLLGSWLIHNLLSAELATVAPEQRLDRSSVGGVLAMICRETRDGHYDGIETMRRLHQLEARGFYVHSLVFALLRLPMQSGGSAVKQVAHGVR